MSKIVSKSHRSFNVFVHTYGQYIAVRQVGLAFGNTAKELYLVDRIEYAEQFYSHITELKAKDYYNKFPVVLENIVNNSTVQRVLAITEYSIEGE